MRGSKRSFVSLMHLFSLALICSVLMMGVGCKSETQSSGPAGQPAQPQGAQPVTPPPAPTAPNQALPAPPPPPPGGVVASPTGLPAKEADIVVKTPTEGLQKDAQGRVMKTRENMEKIREARKNAPTEVRKAELPKQLKPQPDPSKQKPKQ